MESFDYRVKVVLFGFASTVTIFIMLLGQR
jgi:hypothetical protein